MFSISGTSCARFNAPHSTVTANSQQNIVLLLLYDCTCTVFKEFTDIIIAHIRTPDKNNVLSAVYSQALGIPLQQTHLSLSPRYCLVSIKSSTMQCANKVKGAS